MKNIDSNFWNKVELDSENLYTYFLRRTKDYPTPEEYHPIQEWTADMWSVLWNAWLFGNETKIAPELRFGWASDYIKHPITNKPNTFNILHNAGITDRPEHKNCFAKYEYTKKLPFDIEEEDFVDCKYCSLYYIREIIETSKKSCLI
jgi:hypothetical protein